MLRGQKVSEQVKKRLIFGEILTQEVAKKYQNSSNYKDKQTLRSIFAERTLRKYKVKKAIERLIGVNRAKCNTNYKLLQLQIVKEVQDFIERDEFSRCCSGKKDTVTKNKLKNKKGC